MVIPEKYKQDIDKAIKLLKSEGCESVFLFGSLVTGSINDDSDIDLGITGLPPYRFFYVYSKLYEKLETSFDLVDFDKKGKFYSLLKNLGEVEKIG